MSVSGQGQGQPRGVAPTELPNEGAPRVLSLPDVVHRFKTMTTKRYTDGVRQHGWALFPRRLWQRNYYEHVIRDDDDYNRIAEYIGNNPLRWREDSLHPADQGNRGDGHVVDGGTVRSNRAGDRPVLPTPVAPRRSR